MLWLDKQEKAFRIVQISLTDFRAAYDVCILLCKLAEIAQPQTCLVLITNAISSLRCTRAQNLFDCLFAITQLALLCRGDVRCPRRGRDALRTLCSSGRLWCSSTRSGGHTSRPRFLWSLHSLPSRSSPIRTTRSSFIRPRETGIVWESVTVPLCHTLTAGVSFSTPQIRH